MTRIAKIHHLKVKIKTYKFAYIIIDKLYLSLISEV